MVHDYRDHKIAQVTVVNLRFRLFIVRLRLIVIFPFLVSISKDSKVYSDDAPKKKKKKKKKRAAEEESDSSKVIICITLFACFIVLRMCHSYPWDAM